MKRHWSDRTQPFIIRYIFENGGKKERKMDAKKKIKSFLMKPHCGLSWILTVEGWLRELSIYWWNNWQNKNGLLKNWNWNTFDLLPLKLIRNPENRNVHVYPRVIEYGVIRSEWFFLRNLLVDIVLLLI